VARVYRGALLKWWLLTIVLLGSCALDSAAQQSTDPPQSAAEPGQSADRSTAGQPQFTPFGTAPADQPFAAPTAGKANVPQNGPQQGTRRSKDRLFFALPNFLTVEDAGHVKPLTPKDKFSLTARSSFDWGNYLWSAAVAGVSQAENKEPGYGQGAQGYGKRFGAHLADATIENFMTEAVFPSMLHQDPRYFQLGKGSFFRRTEYAASRIFVTRTDSGRQQVNYSEIFGSAGAAAISTYSYYPATDRNWANVLSLWGSSMAYDSLAFVLKEFWPDLRRKLHHSKPAQSPQTKYP
jgi:hypothetical protein